MNRRGFFAVFGAAAVATPVATAHPSRHANEATGAPLCPACGLHVLYLGCMSYPIEPNKGYPVECPCGWTGEAIRVRTPR